MSEPLTPNLPSPSPAPTPVPVIVVAKRYTGFAATSWILIILTCLISIIPVIGFATWVMAFVVIPLVVIFAIVILSRGGIGQGIFLLVAAIILMPGFLLIAPVVSTLVLGASVSAQEKKQEAEIVTNLNNIDAAKAQWSTETTAAAGAAVTMADLAKYLGGKEVKPVVGETYDPHPVGEHAVAKLPSNKSLADHKAGDEITSGSVTAPASVSTTETSAASTNETEASPSPSASAEE